jgi:hypothetical protein
MEERAIVVGLCMGLIFYFSLVLYREAAYMIPTIVKKYNSRKYKNRKFWNRWSINKVEWER